MIELIPNSWFQIKLFILFSIFIPLLTGCWDRMEIEERAVVLGISVDEAVDKQDESEVTHIKSAFPKPPRSMIQVTVQIAVPGRIPLGPGESSGTGKNKPVWVLSAKGYTIDDALMVLQQQLGERMFFGHLRIIVISEKIATSGVQNLNDYLRRSPEVRRLAWMVVSKGAAADLMKAAPQLERVPSLYLLAMMDNAIRMGKLPNDFLGIFWSADSSRGKEPFLPYIEIKKEGNLEISGLAYFRGDKMIGATKPLEIGLFMAVTGVKTGGYNVYEYLPNSFDTIMFKATSRKSRTKVSIKNGRPHINLNLRVEGDIEEKSNELFKIKEHKTILQIQDDISKGSEKGIKELIEKMQRAGSDIFGFGEYVRAKEPEYWNREIKTEEKWQEEFKNLTVDVKMEIRIRRVGMKAT
ncbi:Ger(x)C family spore germination protein [Paenibacillus sp. FSL H7-0331]|uniref:Ger(x)C family spore germination protein n=1 Tax=Paenibacillus sp. FSL H7-0331 TaxID=1920421 RepID=UPI00273F04BC|nr:Ger(x)C family spore germination protein [Paenibacillus sp. FSL H7-0331]